MRLFTKHVDFSFSKKNYGLCCCLFLFVFLAGQQLHSQLVAFPGAEGTGRFTSGGRGTPSVATTVYEVTNLNDDNNPGSLRYALSQTAAYRTIVFRISGTIHLTSRLTIKANTTIAGQTAPGDGICLADEPVVINGDNVIVRYMRFRMGDRYQNTGMVNGAGSDDAFSNLGNKNIIIDHCTSSWSTDEALTIYRGDSITVQWSFITEPLNYSYHFETGDVDFEQHGYGGIWGGRHASFHHNLIAHVKGRAPRFDGSRNLSPFTAGQENADFRNNVIYNWNDYNVNGGEGGNYNIVNNYYKYGPSTSTGNSSGVPVKYMVINPGKQTSAPVLPYGQYYVTGNYVDGSTTITQDNWLGAAMSSGTLADTIQSKVTTPFDLGTITMNSAQDAYDLVLQYGGASFVRDTLDQRIVNDVRNRTGGLIDVQGGYPHGTPYALTVNAWPTLNSTPPPVDTDHDGMPDSYETSNGLNPNDPTDRNGIASNGYTNLENYLNGILDETTVTVSGSLNTFTQNIPAASTVQAYAVAGTNLTDGVTITPPVNFEVSGDGGTTWHGNATPLTITQSGGVLAPHTINVRLNATAAGSYSGNIANTSTGAITATIAVSGNAFASTAPPGTSLVVAQDGSGDYTTVQAAINAAPTGLTAPYIIFIKNGKYKEKITVPSNKPFIQLVGESVANVILYYTDGASDPSPGGGTVGTQNSASFTINANDFSAFNITFENTWGDGTQAVAVLVNADRAVFKNCRFLGNQDTLYVKGSGTPRHYFKNCYIDGNIDFIFGSSIAVFDSTVIYPKSRTTSGSSYTTAANTPPGQAYGFVFRDCSIPNNTGATSYVLGRPWQNSTGSTPLANNKVVFLNTRMGTSIAPEGWAIWDAGTNTSLIYDGEYQSKYFNGTPVDISQRVPWSFQLNATEAATYTNTTLFGSWDPCSVSASVCASQPRDIAIANFRGTKGTTNSTFDWNISWAMDQIKYELYRSATRNTGYAKIGELIAGNDTAINFQLTDALPVAGTSYFYYVVGSKTGYASNITDTVEISSIPLITTTGTVQPFIQNLGVPSVSQNIKVAGENLLGSVTLTPPVNFEISSDGGTTWIANPSTIALAPAGNTLADTTIAIRLNAAAIGDYTDSIMLTTNGGITKYVTVQGTTAVIAASTDVTLLHWPFTTDNNDSALVRATGVLPSIPSFTHLYPSNGTTVAMIPAYSPQFGQAFGATANGDGSWGTGSGGPGGTLKRTYYEQFNVTADNGYKITVDSLYVTSAFYNTSSNTKLAVVYSLSNFTTDSSDVFTIPGGFANPAVLPNQTTGPTQQFPLSVAGLDGITLQPGQTLSFRFYFSCGSSSAGRYAMLKDVKVIGRTTDLSTTVGIIQHWPFTTNAADSLGVRAAGVTASTPTFNKLYVSNGTTIPMIPAYSPQFGQAFGATANGDGSWGTGSGGPGGTLQRTFYEQFTVTANSGYSVRVDSLYVTSAFYNTSSSTKLGVVYSLSNFVSDSADVSTIPGGFANPIALANQSGGPTNQYALQVAGSTGITLLPGQVLTFRFYFSCSSSTAGRYAMLKDVKVTGLSAPILPVQGLIQHWPFTTNATDSLSVRSAGVTASTPTFNKLYVSNGTTIPMIPAYSPQFGQAFGATANGDGSWGTGSGGPGGTLQRTFYEQFTVTANSGYSVRVDSLYVTSAFYNTSSSTKLGVVYSLSNFVSDSADVSTIPGGFANPIALANQSGGPTNQYALQVAGSTGITLLPGQVLTFRFYFSCSSSTAGRYAMLKDVKVTGLVSPFTGPASTITTVGTLNSFTQTIGSPSAVQTYSVSGTGLTQDITITPPLNYEVSGDGGTTWHTNASPLVLTQTGGTIAATTISVRLNALATGAYNGNIANASTGATTVNIAVNGNALPASFITVTGTLNTFSQILGTPSAAQTYSVSGTGLVSDITITPPVNYEISSDGGTTWFTNASPIVLTQTGGVVNATTISVRLNATALGAYNGNISNVSPGAATVNVAVTGNTVPVPSITVTGTLTAFSHTVGTPSATQTYTVSGANLAGNITITPPVSFEISGDGGTTWHTNTTPLVLTPTGGTLANTTIAVRMNATTAGPFSGNIVHTSASAPSVNLPVSGNAIPTPLITITGTLTAFTQVINKVSPAQTFTVTGANLTGNITVTPPANYELSSDGGTNWSATSITLTQAAGSVTATISVRLNAATLGTYTGDITNVSSGADTKTITVTGATVPKPVIIVTQNFGVFTQTVGSAAAIQSYTVAGTNLTGNIVITPPPHFQISINNGSLWQSTPATLTRTNGAVPPTTVLVRLYVSVAGMFSGILSHASSDADTVNVLLNGYNKVAGEYVVYPVPAARTIFIAHPITTGKATLTIYNAAGQNIAAYNTEPGTIETMVDVSHLAQGLYYVEYRLADTKVLLKFMKI